LVMEYQTPDKLRQHALIMTGFKRERKFVASSSAEARKIAVFLQAQGLDDDYAIISVHENVVVEWKAMSQSRKAMPTKGLFRASKDAVLNYLADMIGVKADELQRSEAA
jgi:hypothetical protein